MRRRFLMLMGLIAAGACSEGRPARIGVVMSAAPQQAATLVQPDWGPGESDHFETILTEPLSRWTAEEAIAQATAFAADPSVLAVIGHTNSALSIAASQIYNTAGLVQIAPTSTSPKYDDAGPFSFRLVPSDALQAAYLAKVQQHHWPSAKRIAVVHVNDDYGRGLFRELRLHVDSVVFEGLYTDAADSADIELLARRIIEHRPDLLVWLGRPHPLGGMLPALRAAVPGLTILCSDACDTAIVYRNDAGQFTGMHFVRFTNPAAPDSALRSFQARYRELTGEVASSEALLTYDAVSLIRAALLEGARTRDDVRRYLASLGVDRPAFEGLTGRIEFNKSGTAARTYMLAEVHADGVTDAAHRM